MAIVPAAPRQRPGETASLRRRLVALGHEGPYVSSRDLGRFFTCVIEADGTDFVLHFDAGPGTDRPLYDLSRGRKLLGDEPHDHFADGLHLTWP
ncbi:MAG: hypothetical protein WD534_02600 [Phycisphaeraceae bacterium]